MGRVSNSETVPDPVLDPVPDPVSDPELDFRISDLYPDQDSLPNAGSKTEPDPYLVSDVVIVRLSFVF
jgi:hypothetical protein